MEFKKLLGTRIYLELPEEPKSNLVLDEESKAEVMKQKLKTYGRLKVYAVGNGVGHVVPGDEVIGFAPQMQIIKFRLVDR